jgi:hypothetical protein
MSTRRISSTSVFATSGTVLASALALVLGAGLTFARGPVDPEMDLPIERPTAKPANPPKGPDPVTTTAPLPTAPPPTFFGKDIPATSTIIYVVDQSGSMSLTIGTYTNENGQVVTSGSRFDRAKSELVKSIRSLPKSFTFNVVFYDECVRPWQSKNVSAEDSYKTQAYAFIGAQQPLGFTNTGLGVAQALQDKSVKSVVVLSDGEPNFLDCAMNYVGSYDEHKSLIRQANSQNAQIDCFGIGVAGNPDARSFMQSVAAANGGSYTEIN